jgi:hypothetical protein
MGRPERHDVDYFPFFVKSGKTLDYLELKYGAEGTGYFTNILRFLAVTPDHFYCIKEETERMIFLSRIKSTDEKKMFDVIEIMVKTGKLNKELWEKHKVIASEDFLNSLEEAYKYRNNHIITIDEIKAKFENPQGNPVKQRENGVKPQVNTGKTGLTTENEGHNPQSKVKESKVKESKVKESKDSNESEKEKPFAILSREPKNDIERVNKKWLENYISLFGSQPINPSWKVSTPFVSKVIKQIGIEKALQALDTAMNEKFCRESGYILKTIMSPNVISKLVNKLPGAKSTIAKDNINEEEIKKYIKEK